MPEKNYKQAGVMAMILADRPHAVGVEVGVNIGQTAAWMLELLPGIERYYCVDRWRRVPGYAKQFRTRQKERDTQQFYNDRYREFLTNVALKYPSVVCPIRLESDPAAKAFLHQSVDWVFIDDDHTKADESIRAWWPALKLGGIMFGHDFLERPKQNWNVVETVQRFFPSYHREDHTVWWVEKENAFP